MRAGEDKTRARDRRRVRWCAGHGEHQSPARLIHGGRWWNGHSDLTKARMDRLSGGGRRGEHGEATVKTEFAFLWWFASSATAKLRGNDGGVAELACCARWR